MYDDKKITDKYTFSDCWWQGNRKVPLKKLEHYRYSLIIWNIW